MDGQKSATVASVHQPVMGTTLELRIAARTEDEARSAEAFGVEEAKRLEGLFTIFDEASELCRWRSGLVTEPGPELLALLALADQWQHRATGTFNPMAGTLSRRWRRAEAEGVAPSRQEMAELAAEVAAPRFRVTGGRVERLDDLRDLDLNAVAKGFVVDRVVAAMVATFGLVALTVNAGGDLVHVGSDLVVAIEDPHNPFDNAPPLCCVGVRDRAIATSGAARRWFDVGGRRVNQVLDPRTGWPVEEVASVSVAARDAATADVVATALSVLAPDEVDPFVEPLDVAYLRVATDGTARSNEAWRSMEVRR